ncbi:MAG: helix-turn-helix domain-containing protein [bacterium]|nr:helix-turn-helix domain-containing protein [bacterium]
MADLTPHDPEYMTHEEVAKILRMEPSKVVRLSRRGKLPSMLDVPGTHLFLMLRTDFENFKADNQTSTSAKIVGLTRAALAGTVVNPRAKNRRRA